MCRQVGKYNIQIDIDIYIDLYKQVDIQLDGQIDIKERLVYLGRYELNRQIDRQVNVDRQIDMVSQIDIKDIQIDGQLDGQIYRIQVDRQVGLGR